MILHFINFKKIARYTLVAFTLANFGTAKAQSNLLSNAGFEITPTGTPAFLNTSNAGTPSGRPNEWQLIISSSNCSGSPCALGSATIVSNTVNSGARSLFLQIDKQTNRNDIRLLQSFGNITPVPAGNYVVSFYMKSDQVYPVTVNIFKSTESITSNGDGSGTVATPLQVFTPTSTWRRYKMYVDISTWTVTERTNMRISIRPNTSTALPTGPYPKNIWFDDISIVPLTALAELKDIAIDVAEERKLLAQNAGYDAEANTLALEIEALRDATPGTPLVPQKAIGFNPPPLHTTEATNPFIASLNAWASSYLASSFPAFAKSTPGNFVFPQEYNSRLLGDNIEKMYWLLISPQSNYRNHPELFRRFLMSLYATSDDYLINGSDSNGVPGTTANALNDWFAAPLVTYGWYMSEFSFPDYIPTSLKQKMRGAADEMGRQFFNRSNIIFSQTELLKGIYTNRDISYAEVLIHAGLYRNNNGWIDRAKVLVDSLHQYGLYPDGGYSYIKKQNEVANYHGGTTASLAKIWAMIEYQPAWDIISKSANYEILDIEPLEVPEYYTAGAWKTMWNGATHLFSRSASLAPILYITENPYLKSVYDRYHQVYGFDGDPLSVTFHKMNLSSSPVPDNFFVYNRNIQGPKARYGRFSYAASGRNVSGNEDFPGAQTIVGAMTTQPGRFAGQDEMDAALMAVHAKVHVRNFATSTRTTEWTDWGYMSTKMNAKSNVAKTAATISTPSILQYQTSGPRGFDTNWASFQQWIMLPDRMVGLVEVYPKDNVATQAGSIDGRIRFTYGRFGLLNPKVFTIDEPGKRYTYGGLRAIIHQHDFTSVDTAMAGTLRDFVRLASEIRLRFNLSTGTTPFTYPANTRKFFITEIRRANATGEASVSRLTVNGVKGLVVRLNGAVYASFRNDNNTNVTLNLDTLMPAGNQHEIHFTRGDNFVPSPQTLTARSYSIAANEQILFISSNDSSILGSPWLNFNQTLATSGIYTLPVSLLSFNGFNQNNEVKLAWSTATETNNQKFHIYRSNDGKNFHLLKSIAGVGNSSVPQNYSLTDAKPLSGTNYYKLVQVDFDGKSTELKIIAVNTGISNQQELDIIVLPSEFKLSAFTAKEENAKLYVYDISGKCVQTSLLSFAKGENHVFLSKVPLVKGVYIVKLEVGTKQVHKKFIHGE
ncbi:T9SS type A sorting domain-containing protein [Pedobacter aquae]|uniref:T9SS type A sorting domain-containing protein n=1 Tax=Pedobacter aquae TaxID=2605747 RepID=A0A5C0VIC5_9SPHI|nr:T9SS type A sorting domain-containing protein [Pedobacter aquae]QEK51847.1 T9SS type A sorting domain-containing protein [Pedobacter aquae]